MKGIFFSIQFGKRRILNTALFIGLLIAVLSVFWNDNMGNDTAAYYSRMAQQFIDGNYSRAFFHSIPPLTPAVAGIIGKLGMNGWTAMKVLSALCFLGLIYWSYRLFLLVLPDRQAQWGAFLYSICSYLTRYSIAGQLEGPKMFLLLFSFERAFSFVKTRKKGALLGAAIGGSLLILARNEGIMYFPLLLGFVFMAEWFLKTGDSFLRKACKGSTRCLLMAIIAGAICAPWLVFQHQTTGVAVIGTRQISVLALKLPFINVPAVRRFPSVALKQEPALKEERLVSKDRIRRKMLVSSLTETAKGVYPLYFIPMLAGLFFLLRRNAWKQEYNWFLAVFAYQLVVDWAFRPVILKRFMIPVVPFYFSVLIAGLAPFGARIFGADVKFRRTAVGFAVLLTAVLLWDGLVDVRKTLRGKTAEEKQTGLWIREHIAELDVLKSDPLRNGKRLRDYHTGDRLVIASMVPQPVFWAGADMMSIPERCRFRKLPEALESAGVDLIIVDAKFKKRFPLFEENSSPYRAISLPWEADEMTLFVYDGSL